MKIKAAEAFLAGNCLLTINKANPYGSLYGRVPNLLPDMNLSPAASDDSDGALPGESAADVPLPAGDRDHEAPGAPEHLPAH